MKESRRALRMERHYKRNKNRASTLNMVSLMDIFTILVFFLLVTAADSEVLPSPKTIKLPESLADKRPKENIIIMVNRDEIFLQGKKVSSTEAAIKSRGNVIPDLLAALQQEATATKKRRLNETQIKKQGVTIMGDKKIPYQILKKIMVTCASTEFTNISLAVVKKQAPEAQ